jgi:hypothetical protein
MKNAWKWILGIIIVVLIVAAVVAVPFAMRSYMMANRQGFAQRANIPQNANPQAPGNNTAPAPGANNAPQGPGVYGGPMMRGFGGRQGNFSFSGRPGPMMGYGGGSNRGFGGSRFGFFGFGFPFIGGLMRLIPWIILALLLWGAYQIGKRSGMRSVQTAAPTAAAAPAQPAAVESTNNDTPSI